MQGLKRKADVLGAVAADLPETFKRRILGLEPVKSTRTNTTLGKYRRLPTYGLPNEKPTKEQYPELSKEELQLLYQRWWRNQDDHREKQRLATKRSLLRPGAKEKCREQNAKRARQPKTRQQRAEVEKTEKRQTYKKEQALNLRHAKDAIRAQLSSDGHCSGLDDGVVCPVPSNVCDIHHLSPNEIAPDGKKRKQREFGRIQSMKGLHEELERNTDSDGNLLLQLLCLNHHARITFGVSTLWKPTKKGQGMYDLLVSEKIRIGKCQFEQCLSPNLRCTRAADSPVFHFDHIYARFEKAPKGMEKIACVSTMARTPTRYSVEDVKAEIAKCQLLHAQCHFMRTQKQFQARRASRLAKVNENRELDESEL